MATRKNSDSERLDDTTIERVIKMLEPKDGSKPCTKKDACAVLGITYNTTRLGSIIEKYKEKKAQTEARKAEKRGTPATDAEISYTIQAYLEGSTIDSISSALYRGPTFIRSLLDRYGVPIRQSAHSYFRPNLVPDEAIRQEFKVGELAYSMRYDSLCRIMSEFSKGVYRINVLGEKWLCSAYQPSEELASVEHLKKYLNVV